MGETCGIAKSESDYVRITDGLDRIEIVARLVREKAYAIRENGLGNAKGEETPVAPLDASREILSRLTRILDILDDANTSLQLFI